MPGDVPATEQDLPDLAAALPRVSVEHGSTGLPVYQVGHNSFVGRLGELSRAELAEVIEDAWLTRASARRALLHLEGPGRITG